MRTQTSRPLSVGTLAVLSLVFATACTDPGNAETPDASHPAATASSSSGTGTSSSEASSTSSGSIESSSASSSSGGVVASSTSNSGGISSSSAASSGSGGCSNNAQCPAAHECQLPGGVCVPLECGFGFRACGNACAFCPSSGVTETACAQDRCVATACADDRIPCPSGCCHWQLQDVPALMNASTAEPADLAIDPQQVVHVAYMEEQGATMGARYASFVNGAWQTEVIADGLSTAINHMTVQPFFDGRGAVVLHRTAQPEEVRFKEGAAWRLVPAPQDWTPHRVRATADGSVLARITLSDGTAKFIARLEGSTWVRSALEEVEGMLVDAAGVLHVVHWQDGQLHYRGGAWGSLSDEVLPPLPAGAGVHEVHLVGTEVWVRYRTQEPAEYGVLRRVGTQWFNQALPGGVESNGVGIQFGTDGRGQPVIFEGAWYLYTAEQTGWRQRTLPTLPDRPYDAYLVTPPERGMEIWLFKTDPSQGVQQQWPLQRLVLVP